MVKLREKYWRAVIIRASRERGLERERARQTRSRNK